MASILMSIVTTRPIEDLLGFALYSRRGHDDGLLKASPTVSSAHPTPTIIVSAPDIGPSGTAMPAEYGNSSIGGGDKIPTISWSAPVSVTSQVKEWVLACEDADVPMVQPIVHGIYYGIAPDKTKVIEADFEKMSTDEDEKDRRLRGGFEYGVNGRKNVYVWPRPIARHGPHRYFWTVFALSEKIDFGTEEVDKDVLLKRMEGKIVGWGDWVGTYERK